MKKSKAGTMAFVGGVFLFLGVTIVVKLPEVWYLGAFFAVIGGIVASVGISALVSHFKRPDVERRKIRGKLPEEIWILGLIGTGFVGFGLIWLGPAGSSLGWIFLLPGIGILGFSGFLLSRWIRKWQYIRALVRKECFVSAQITDCQYNESVSYDGVHPWQLVAKYKDGSGAMQTFRSEDVRDDRAPRLVGKTVRVYTDGHPEYYWVDVQPLLWAYIEAPLYF